MKNITITIILSTMTLLTSCVSTSTPQSGSLLKQISKNKGVFLHPGFKTETGDKISIFRKECNPERLAALKSVRSSVRVNGGRCWIEKMGEGVVDKVNQKEITISAAGDFIDEFVWIDKSVPIKR